MIENGQVTYYTDETCTKARGTFKLKDSTFKVVDEYIEGRNQYEYFELLSHRQVYSL